MIRELQLKDAQQFRNFTRMSAVEVQRLVNMLAPVIGKQDTAMRNAISVEERVILTLRFLASVGAPRTVTVEDQRSYIKIETLRGKTLQKFTVLCVKFVVSRQWT